MKKTRKEKRISENGFRSFKELIKIIRHYFPDFNKLLSQIDDPRHQSFITYMQEEILFTRIISYCCHLKSMKEINRELNNDNVIKSFKYLFGEELEEIPHGDTINNYLKEVEINQLRNILYEMVRHLMNKKFFDGFKINNEYYHVIVDGVELFSMKAQKIEGSIKKEHHSGTRYYTMMLVAVIERDNMVIPLDFEPIENEIIYDKQDCEQKAAKRLMKRIKHNFKRMKICFSGDALYFSEPIIKMIEEYHWKYIITYKEGCSTSVTEYYDILEKNNDLNTAVKGEKVYDYYNGVEFKEMEINIIRLKTKGKTFIYATNFKISDSNIERMIKNGRKRWKIENKGFNDLKNKGYNLGHIYSYDENAVKGHFILLLMTHMIMQLMEQHERNREVFETIHKMALRIKEALRTQPLSANDVRDIIQPLHLSRISL